MEAFNVTEVDMTNALMVPMTAEERRMVIYALYSLRREVDDSRPLPMESVPDTPTEVLDARFRSEVLDALVRLEGLDEIDHMLARLFEITEVES